MSKTGLDSEDTRQLPSYTNHRDFGKWVISSRANICCLCSKGVINYINPIGVHLLQGNDASEFIGQELAAFVDPSFGEMIALGLEIFTEEESGIPLKMITVNKTNIDVIMVVTRLNTDNDGNDTYLVECNNITQLLLASKSARRREQQTAGILKTISDGIITTDDRGIIQSANPSNEAIFGYTDQQLIGQNISILMPDPFQSAHDGYIANYIKTGRSEVLGTLREVIGLRSDGIQFPIEITVSELHLEDDHRIFTTIVRDITSRKRHEEQMEYIAHHDALTDLPNRHLFDDRLERALVWAKRENRILALLYIDLDKFKPINDTLGHEAGDLVLKTVSKRLLHCSRASDTVARVGGDEFVVILERISHIDDAGRIAQTIIDALTEPVSNVAEDCIIGASIGISIFPDDATDSQSLMRCADETMYKVKESGRNNFRYHTKSTE